MVKTVISVVSNSERIALVAPVLLRLLAEWIGGRFGLCHDGRRYAIRVIMEYSVPELSYLKFMPRFRRTWTACLTLLAVQYLKGTFRVSPMGRSESSRARTAREVIILGVAVVFVIAFGYLCGYRNNFDANVW